MPYHNTLCRITCFDGCLNYYKAIRMQVQYERKSKTTGMEKRNAPSTWYLFLSCCAILESIAGNRRPGADVDGANRSPSLVIPPFEVEGDDFSTTSTKRFLLSEPSRYKDASPPFALIPLLRPSIPREELRSFAISLNILLSTPS